MMRNSTEGFHTSYKFRQDDDLKYVPILMLTSVNQKMDLNLDIMDKKNKVWIGRIIFLIIILIISLYMFTWTGTIRCSSVPGLCNVYWGVQSIVTGKAQPSILIVYDPKPNAGMGNPELLRELISDRSIVGMHPNMANINYLSSDQLKHVSLVIVEHARQISTTNLITFLNYVNQGGRLVWIGDSGIEKSVEDSYFVNPATKEYDGWTRTTDENMLIRFNAFLGAKYLTSFCDIKDCSSDIKTGKLVSQSDHALVNGLRNNLPIYDNYCIVKLTASNPTPLKVDYGSNLINNDGKDFGSTFPMIITSNSNRVTYYAIPPELLNEETDDDKYLLIIENLIDGMFR
jgi:hypothetical protein